MRLLITTAAACVAMSAQNGPELLGWRLSTDSVCSAATKGVAACRLDPVPANEAGWRKALAAAARSGVSVVVAPATANLALADKAGADENVTVAVMASNQPEAALKAVSPYGKHVGLWADPAAWDKSGTRPLAAIYMLRERLAGGTLTPGPVSEEFVKEAYRLDLKPLVWVIPSGDSKLKNTVDALVSYHAQYAGRTPGVRRLAEITPEERSKMEAAIPASAPATPKKPRRLLVFDLNVGRFGHPSIPYANLAMQLMGTKTGAWEATVSSDPAVLDPASLRRFDAVFLNNTIGDIFSTAAVRDGFASYIAGGGGLIGNHATTVTATDWKEFGDILGGRGASHRMTDERVSITVEDSANPITRVFGAGPFEYADEFFRFQPPYSRENVRVLLSVDPIRTNLNQGRCFGRCYRDDNDYPVAWIKRYGKGRVFYTTLGHNPYVFEDSKMLAFFLAGIQYALGDLTADDTPRPRAPADLEAILGELTKWDRGQNQAPVRRLERALASGGNFEPRLAGFLASGASAAAKGEVCRQLADVGTAASVPALAKLLEQADTGEMARYALERIPDPSAVTALREAMAAAPNVRAQTAILYSLGRRRDEASVGTLSNLLDSSDASVAAAAANALGLIGSPEAERALASVPLNRVTEDALLNLADHASDERAVTIYRKLADAKFPSEIRTSALRALARRTGAQSVPLLKDACTEASADVRTAAIAELARLDGGAVAAVYPNLDAAGKIEALSQLAVSNASSAGPLLREALSADSPELRAAGIQGLAEAGTDADVVRLLEIAARAGSRADGVEARLALARMTARGVDAALIAALKSLQAPAIRTEVVRAIGERGAAEATDALIAVAAGGDPNLRTAALRAIRNLAKPEHAAALVDLLVKAGEEDRKDAELALSAAVRRAEQPDVKPVVTAYRGASDSETKASLLSVMASTGSARALPVLREATQSNDAALQRAAVAGLAEWPSPEPMNDLLGVAKSSAAEPIKVLALRGYIKLAQVPVGRAPAETAKLLRSAMESANRPEEKKLAIAALQRVPDAESLAIVRAAVADPAVAAEAKLAVATLERSLAAPRRNE